MINDLITKLRLPKDCTKLQIGRQVKFKIFRPKLPSCVMIRLEFSELWWPKFGLKCQFFRFLKGILILNFFPDYKFEILIFKSTLYYIRIRYHHIWSFSAASQMKKTFRLDSVLNIVLVVFGQYFLP